MLKTVIQIIKEGVHANARKESSCVLKVMRRRKSLKVEDGVLYRQIQGKDRDVLPQHFVDKVLNMAHSEMGHQGRYTQSFTMVEWLVTVITTLLYSATSSIVS